MLGYLIWFHVPQAAQLPLGAMTEWFDELDLDPAYLPVSHVVPANAFRRACREVQIKHAQLEEVSYDARRIVYQLVRKSKESKNVIHAKVGEVVYYKRARGRDGSTDRLRTTLLDNVTPAERKVFDDALATLRTRLVELCGHHDANKIRGTIRDYLFGLQGILLRPAGGVYFIPPVHGDVLLRLGSLIRKLGQGSLWHVVQLSDEESHRTIVQEQFTAYARSILNALEEKVGALQRVHPERLAELETEYQEVAASYESYVTIVDLPSGLKDTLQEVLELLMTASDRIETQRLKRDEQELSQGVGRLYRPRPG